MLENFYLCGIKHNKQVGIAIGQEVVICLKISIFVVSNTTKDKKIKYTDTLWFAWKFLSLWYQTQPTSICYRTRHRCDLLENFYLCGIKHNSIRFEEVARCVVICLKISIFVVSNTTVSHLHRQNTLLWFAWKFLSLWYQTQLPLWKPSARTVVICLKISIFVVSNTTTNRSNYQWTCCDLLENFYLCGIKHNN